MLELRSPYILCLLGLNSDCEEGRAGWTRKPEQDGQGLEWLDWGGGVGKAEKASPVPPGLLTSDPTQTGSAISVGPDPRGEGM